MSGEARGGSTFTHGSMTAMSERNHSPSPETPTKTKNKLLPVIAGSALLVIVAGVWFQVFRPSPAASQTDGRDQTGRATLSGESTQQVLATVNGEPIPYDAVAKECVARHGEEVLENLINRMLIQQECSRRGVTVTKAEVQQEVMSIAKKFNLPLDTWYQMLQAERGLTREQYHNDIIWPMIALKKLAGKDVNVSEEDMQRGFERDYGPRVKARLILVDGNVRQANQIWEKAQANPDDFDRLAREHSADPNTRPLGGVIPPIRKHGGNRQIEDVAFKMQPNEISPVIQVDENRYVILKCEGVTEPVVTDIKAVWNDLYAQLVEEETQKAVATVFEGIKGQAQVHNFLTRKSTSTSPYNSSAIQRTSSTAAPGSVVPAQGTATR